MGEEMELQQMIYNTLLAQIQFGFYKYKCSLSPATEMSEHFHVSVDTVQLAYRRLKKEGYISLSRNVGAKVIVAYSDAEIEQHIQTFFSFRKDALLDLGSSMQPLFGRIQWLSLKYASPQTLASIEHLSEQHAQQPDVLWQYYEQKYDALGNAILPQLARQIFLFFQAPFFSVAEHTSHLVKGSERIRHTLELCRRQDWPGLQRLLNSYHNDLNALLRDFYQARIVFPSLEEQVAFRWSSYKKAGQLCYSLAVELLIAISRGIYPEGSFLPTREQLSEEKGVSISTIRRAVGLLCDIGAVKSCRPRGMQVLPFIQSTENCDFTQPVIRNRLLNVVESLQFFSLSCRAVCEITLTSLDAHSIGLWREKLMMIKDIRHYDVLSYAILDLIAKTAPYKTIQLIYSELLKQLFWGNALRGLRGTQETANRMFEPYLTRLIDCLEECNFSAFSDKVEELMLFDLKNTIGYLLQVGIHEANKILIPEKDEW